MAQTVGITIQFCPIWEYESQSQAVGLADHLFSTYQNRLREFRLVPGEHGMFEVWLDDELVHSRRRSGKFPNHEDLEELINERLAEE